ncbi:MAG: Required for respiratory growth protein 9 mitochondrial [Stictis urceolatum]|nr:Required for respiratory growth protein 9 mitochondrial [Stictis urceolata]
MISTKSNESNESQARGAILEPWQTQKNALKKKLGGQAWLPRKRLSPDALDGIRELHAQDPARYSTAALADQFNVSPDAIRRILKSKWIPNAAEQVDRRRRWQKRGESIWSQMAELGVKPPKKWRDEGITTPHRMYKAKQSPHVAIAPERLQPGKEGSSGTSLFDRIL